MLLVQGIGSGHLGYYALGQPPDAPPARFAGRGAAELGLLGSSASLEALRALGSGVDPRSGLVLDAGHRRVRHAAYDCVFTVAKSVSLLFALGGEEVARAVRDAHVVARDGALGYLERSSAFVWDWRSAELAEAGGLLSAAFVHHLSRAGDPHLHSHVLVVNLVPSESRGWSALAAGPLFAERAAARRLYEAELRFQLQERLGSTFSRRSAPGSDVAGFSDRVIDAFSERRRAILADGHQAGRAGLGRRPPKLPEAPRAELAGAWSAKAAALGVRRSASAWPAHLVRGDAALRAALERAIETFDRPFTKSELISTALRPAGLIAPLESVEGLVDELCERDAARLTFPTSVLDAPTRAPADRRRLDRYANPSVLEALALEADLLASARPLEVGRHGAVALDEERDGRGALCVLELGPDPLAAYAACRQLAPVEVIAARDGAAAGFEALTGLPATRAGARRAPVDASPLIVVDPWRFGVRARLDLLRRSLRGGRVVVLCGSPSSRAGRHESAPEFDHLAAARDVTEAVQVGAVRVVFSVSLSGLLAATSARATELGASARVLAPAPLPGALSRAQLAALERSGRRRRGEPVLVIGGSRLCPAEVRRDVLEYHVVRPIGLDRRERSLLAIALAAPPRLIERFGVPGPSRHAALAWATRATLGRAGEMIEPTGRVRVAFESGLEFSAGDRAGRAR